MAKKNNKNLVSVIICFLNGEKFIREAIESVLVQTYSKWELFLIDDGSTDGSTNIARQYAEQYPQKVAYIEHDNHKNLGLSPSRNLGINKSNGEYIAFLDADDVWLPQKLKEQIEIMHSHPEVSMVCGRELWWFSWSGRPADAKKDRIRGIPIKPNAVIKPPRLLRIQVSPCNFVPGTCGLLIRREMINRIGGFEESFPNMLEDQAFYIKVFLEETIFVSSKIWFKYRKHRDSICYSIGIQKHCAISLRFWKWAKQYLTNKGFKDKEIMSGIEEKIRKRRLGQLFD